MRRLRDAVPVDEGQPGLLAVGVGQPTKKMIEAAVFRGQDDDVCDPRGLRTW